jgi:hypothetical protein
MGWNILDAGELGSKGIEFLVQMGLQSNGLDKWAGIFVLSWGQKSWNF